MTEAFQREGQRPGEARPPVSISKQHLAGPSCQPTGEIPVREALSHINQAHE